MRPDVKLRTVLLTTAAFALAAACTPAAEGPAPATPAAGEIAKPTTPSGPAAENTTDSLASTPADAAPATDTSAPAVTPAPATPTVAPAGPTAEELANGKAAYAQTCAMCHGPTGAGTQMGVALTAGLDYAAIKEKIVKGKIAPTDTMPPMGAAYSEDQLDDLSKFVEAGLPQ
jgi:mono/diheme cytochrome c family protein